MEDGILYCKLEQLSAYQPRLWTKQYLSASGNSSGLKYPSKENLLRDLRYLYESLLHPQTMHIFSSEGTRAVAISSSQKLFDCKQFVKDYNPEMLAMTNLHKICLSCQVEVVDESEESTADLPPELIVLPINAMVADLKIEAANAFQDVYLMFRRFQVDELLGHSGVDDSTQVQLLVESGDMVHVRGRCISKIGLSKFRREKGMEKWTVDCSCGAKDDDGKRMLACDICGGMEAHKVFLNIDII